MKPKAQVDILTSIIVVIMSIALVSTAYLWGLPLIQKRQGKTVIERVYEQFNQENVNSLSSKIEYIANMGGEESFTVGADGLWVLSNSDDWIQFTFSSKMSNIGYDMEDGWISLTSEAFCPPTVGKVGTDRSSVVCAKADTYGDTFNITYRVWFREVWDDIDNPTKGYKINLIPKENDKSTWKTIRISRDGVPSVESSQTKPNLDVTVTKIKILFA